MRDLRYPAGVYCYGILILASAVVTLAGEHRVFFRLLQNLGFPELSIAALSGLLSLSWYELAYVVGGGLKNVSIFLAIPIAGSIGGIVSVAALFINSSFRSRLLLGYLACCLLLGILSLGVLAWRYVRGIEDLWRITSTIGFLLVYASWFVYFLRLPSLKG